MPNIVAAGLPAPLGQSRDYDRIFATLADAGVAGFFPDFAWPQDFEPPCGPDDESFSQLRRHGRQLLIPGHRLYPVHDFPSLANDPLRRVLECAGRAQVMGITSYDEPAFAHELSDVRRLYERVKEIDASLPVWMVHAPIPRWIPDIPVAESRRRLGANGTNLWIPIERYLAQVRAFSAFADLVGFDVYPIPEAILDATTTPYRGGLPATDHRCAVGDYVRWLREELRMPCFIVLQGFTMERNTEALEMYGLSGSWRAPTPGELADMVAVSVEGGVDAIVWWGSSLLEADDLPLWDAVLAASRYATNPGGRS